MPELVYCNKICDHPNFTEKEQEERMKGELWLACKITEKMLIKMKDLTSKIMDD